MKKVSFLLIFIFFLLSCQSAKDALTLKKKSTTDEFLVEKKSPLVMPPDYGKLPKPDEDKENQEIAQQSNTNNIKDLISSKEDSPSQEKKIKPSSLEKLILEKIN